MTAKDQFWRPVVSGDYIGGIHAPLRLIKNFCSSQVSYFNLKGQSVGVTLLGLLKQDILRLEVSVWNAFLVHLVKSHEELLNIVAGWTVVEATHFFIFAQFILQTVLAELHDSVLDDALLLVDRVEKVTYLHYIRTATHEGQNFVLAWDHVADFHCAFESDTLSLIFIESLEYVSFKSCGNQLLISNLPNAPCPMTLMISSLGTLGSTWLSFSVQAVRSKNGFLIAEKAGVYSEVFSWPVANGDLKTVENDERWFSLFILRNFKFKF